MTRAVLVEPGDATTAIAERRRLAPARPDSSHAESCRRALAVQAREERRGLPPEAIAAAIDRAISSNHPRARYVVAPSAESALAALRPLFPDWLYDLFMARYCRVG